MRPPTKAWDMTSLEEMIVLPVKLSRLLLSKNLFIRNVTICSGRQNRIKGINLVNYQRKTLVQMPLG